MTLLTLINQILQREEDLREVRTAIGKFSFAIEIALPESDLLRRPKRRAGNNGIITPNSDIRSYIASNDDDEDCERPERS